MLPQNQEQFPQNSQQQQYYYQQQPEQYQLYPQNQPIYSYQNPNAIQQVEQIQVKENSPNPPAFSQSQAIVTAVPLSNIKHETHSHHPQQIVCPNCNQLITTSIKYEIGAGTWAMVLFFCCIFIPIMCIPFCCYSMQDVVHQCPLCNAFCGRKKFLC